MRAYFQIDEQRVGTHDTARFPFVVEIDRGEVRPSVHDFRVECDDERFDANWATIVAQNPSPPEQSRYTLSVKVNRGVQKPYGRYELRLRVLSSGQELSPLPETLLIVKPCVHLTHPPALRAKANQTAELTFSVANCGAFDCSVSVNIHHHGSQWSRQWSIELGADAGPFDLSEELTLPSGRRSAEFDLTVSAENLTIATYPLHRPVRFPNVKKAALSAGGIVAIGAVAAIGLTASGGSNPPLTPPSTTSTSPSTTSTSPSTTTTSSSTTTTDFRGNSGGGSEPPVSPVFVTVPDVTRDSLNVAELALTQVNLHGEGSAQECSNEVASGLVLSSSPSAGSRVLSDTFVELTQSSGACTPPLISVPPVVGETSTQASSQLSADNLVASSTSTGNCDVDGQVIAQDPSADTLVQRGSTVTIMVCSNPPIS
jgi:hypothetical protein